MPTRTSSGGDFSIRFEFQPTFADQYLAHFAVLRHSPVSTLVAHSIFPLLGIAILVSSYISEPEHQLPLLFPWVLALLCMAFTPLIMALVLMINRRAHRNLVTGKHTLVLSPDGVRMAGPVSETFVKWEAMERIVETHSFVLLFFSRGTAFFLPKRSVPSAQELASLRQFVSLRLKQKPHQVA